MKLYEVTVYYKWVDEGDSMEDQHSYYVATDKAEKALERAMTEHRVGELKEYQIKKIEVTEAGYEPVLTVKGE